MTYTCDLAVVGSGFGGALLSMIAARLGLRVLLLERGRHPRFAIGESASPLAGILLEQLADRYDLPRVRVLSTFGTWQRACPEIGCGLKRGFSFFRHETGASYRVSPDRGNQLLVAASPNDEVSDTHWLRADVDHFLVREASALGVEYLDELQLMEVNRGSGALTLRGRRRGAPTAVTARFVVDASGPRGFLARAMELESDGFLEYPRTQALFSHFTGVARCGDMAEYATALAPPYPIDDAAVHHVFDGGWMWVLRFGTGVTSAGIAVTDAVAAELRLADGEPAWRRCLARYPSIAAQFAASRPIREFTWMPQLAWRARAAAGRGWAMLPSAAAFVDPLFSTGIPLTLLGVERIARWLEGRPEGRPLRGDDPRARSGGPSGPPSTASCALDEYLDEYNAVTLAEADHTARFIAGCYAGFPRFEEFTTYSMCYFAAASYSELARRLGTHPRAGRFLAADRARFAAATVALSPQSGPHADYVRRVADAIDPINIAGLCDPAKQNWYGVEAADAIAGAGKLGVSRTAVAQALAAAGVLEGAEHGETASRRDWEERRRAE